MHSTRASLLALLMLTAGLPALADDTPARAPAADTSPTTLSDSEAQRLFAQAMEQRDSGEVFSAIKTFEYILTRRPSLNRARLELAVSYHRASRYQDAVRELQAVLDNPETPEKVRLAVLAYLGQLSQDEKKPDASHEFSAYIKAGGLYNTNINFAPLRGSPAYQIPDGQDTASPGIETFVSGSHRYRRKKPLDIAGLASELQWQSQASWTGNNYTRTGKYNLNILSLSTGPALIAAGHWRTSFNLQVDQTWFGPKTLGTFLSLNPLFTVELGNYRSMTFELSWTNNDYSQPADDGRKGHSLLFGGAFTTLLGGVDSGLEAGFRLIDQPAKDAQYGYNSGEIYAGGFTSAGAHANVYLNLHLQKFNFDGADAVTGSVRHELESRVQLGYNNDISEGALKDWTLNLYTAFTKNNSNVDAFSYERWLVGLNLARYFQ